MIKGLKTKINKLVKLGKEKGFVSEQEIKDTLEGIEINEEVLANVNIALEENNIATLKVVTMIVAIILLLLIQLFFLFYCFQLFFPIFLQN